MTEARGGDQDLLQNSQITVAPGASPPLEFTVRTDGGTVEGSVAREGAAGRLVVALAEDGGPGRVTYPSASGAFRFVQISKALAPWCSNMLRPFATFAPALAATRSNSVSAGR